MSRLRWKPGHPIRVLHFISNSYPSDYFPVIARYTDHDRFAIQVGSLDRPGGLQEQLRKQEIPAFALGIESRSRYPLAVMRLASRLLRERVDVLHTHLFDASLVGLTAAKLARTPLAIFTGHHSHEVPLHNQRLLFELDRLAARRLADVVIAPSAEMRDTFVNAYGCNPERVEVIEHGINLARFDPQRANGQAVRAELGLEHKLVFGSVSKYFWIKNLDALVHAFAAIAEKVPDAHLVIVGLGDRSGLAALVEELGLTERTSLLAARGDVPDVMAAFDVLVQPALAESFGLALLEGMAMQRVVVATPVGIARDILEDGVSGIRIAGTDASAIELALRRSVAHRDEWLKMGTEAQRRAQAFTPERWVRAHERLYERRLGLE